MATAMKPSKLQLEIDVDAAQQIWVGVGPGERSAPLRIERHGGEFCIVPQGGEAIPLDAEWQNYGGLRLRAPGAPPELSIINQRPPRPPELRVRVPDRSEELRFVLSFEEGRSWRLGREKGLSIQVPDSKVSRSHMRLWAQNGRVHAEDLEPTWPTLQQGQELDGPIILQHGDELQVGDSFVRFVDVGEEARLSQERIQTPSPQSDPAEEAQARASAARQAARAQKRAARRAQLHQRLARLGRYALIVGSILATIGLVVAAFLLAMP
jgi:hypothetical protein